MDRLYHCDGAYRKVFRYKLDGSYDNVTFEVGVTVYNMLFDGRDMCVSENNNNVFCYQLVSRNIYDSRPRSNATQLIESSILSLQQRRDLTNAIAVPGRNVVWKRCYSGTVDGFSSNTFHSKCDKLGQTLTIARVSSGGVPGRVFGGFSTTPWTSRSSYAYSNGNWLYRFAPMFQRTDATLANPNYGTYDHVSYCPTFGSGHDLYIDNACQVRVRAVWRDEGGRRKKCGWC